VFEGSNMADCHPVAFHWPTQAKLKGPTLIHVDPRFTRTSAMCDFHAPVRAGSDIAFFGMLFLFSAASTAAAVLILLGVWRDGRDGAVHWPSRFDGVALVLELFALIAQMASLGTVAGVCSVV
jgi:hypothetical protein